MLVLDLPEQVYPLMRSSVVAVGSRVTCDPAPTNTDADFLCYAGDPAAVKRLLEKDGWELGGSSDTEWAPTDFNSYRKGVFNLIVAYNKAFHSKFICATALCKRLNLLGKADRIATFQAVMSGVVCS